ncbi:MAG: GNAT family N-acetyltransferase [Peptococcaceae bacterium]|nr:GNAT family N-acetyltransferase [Peptococcaceae bacterium]
MNLQAKRVAVGTRSCGRARELYLQAFPKEERFPFALLQAYSAVPSVDFWAFYDVGRFSGMAYVVRGESVAFVLYLAVAPQARGRGVGSEMLGWLKARYAPLTLTLNIEPVVTTAPNYVERAKRLAFYAKNGFHLTGYALDSGCMTYHILATTTDFDPRCLATVRPKWMPAAKIFPIN